MTKTEALRLVLIFHNAAPWDKPRQELWALLTGDREPTTRVLCDCVREALAETDA